MVTQEEIEEVLGDLAKHLLKSLLRHLQQRV